MGFEWFDILMYLSIASPLVPFVFLFIRGEKTPEVLRNVLFMVIVCSLIADMLSLILAKYSINNYPVFHFYTLVSGFLLLYLYRRIIHWSWIHYLTISIGVMIVAVFSYEVWLREGIYHVNTYTSAMTSISMVSLSLLYFYSRLDLIQSKEELYNSYFWVNCALLIYFGSTFFVTLFEEYVRNEKPSLFAVTWPIQFIATIVFNLILAKGIWATTKT